MLLGGGTGLDSHYSTGNVYLPCLVLHFPHLHVVPLCPHRRGTYVFTRLVSQRKDDIVADFNVDENNWDADALSCTKMGQHSQEKFGSAGDFETDGIAWDADPISGSTISGSTTCF